MYFLGIDVGSIATKAVVFNAAKQEWQYTVVKTGAMVKTAISNVLSVLEENPALPRDVFPPCRPLNWDACMPLRAIGAKASVGQ